MRLTKKTIEKLTEEMLKRPKEAGVMYENGEIGCEYGGRYYRLTPAIVPAGGNEPREIWRGYVVDLIQGVNPKLKYKTHLAPYLYQTLNRVLESKRGGNTLTGNPTIDGILKSEKYQNYLYNEEIELERVVITEYEITISAESTGLANHKLRQVYEKDYLEELWDKARGLAVNDTRAKVRKPYKYNKVIESKYDEYEDAIRQYKEDFTQLGKLWEWKLNTDGIHMGYNQDDIYNKVIIPVEFRLQKMGYNNGIIRQVERLAFDLKETIKKTGDENIVSYTVNL